MFVKLEVEETKQLEIYAFCPFVCIIYFFLYLREKEREREREERESYIVRVRGL